MLRWYFRCGNGQADRLTVRQGEAASIETENNRVTAVTTATGARIPCRAVVVATGVYLKGSIIIGEHRPGWTSGLWTLMKCRSRRAMNRLFRSPS